MEMRWHRSATSQLCKQLDRGTIEATTTSCRVRKIMAAMRKTHHTYIEQIKAVMRKTHHTYSALSVNPDKV